MRRCERCGKPLPPAATARRKFCDASCRVAHDRADTKAKLVRVEPHPELGFVRVKEIPLNRRSRKRASSKDVHRALQMIEDGASIAQVARTVDRGESTIRGWVAKAQQEPEPSDEVTPDLRQWKSRVRQFELMKSSGHDDLVNLACEFSGMFGRYFDVKEVLALGSEEAQGELPHYHALLRVSVFTALSAPPLLRQALDWTPDYSPEQREKVLASTFESWQPGQYRLLERSNAGELVRRPLDANDPADQKAYEVQEAARSQLHRRWKEAWRTLPQALEQRRGFIRRLEDEGRALKERADSLLLGFKNVVVAQPSIALPEGFIEKREQEARRLRIEIDAWCAKVFGLELALKREWRRLEEPDWGRFKDIRPDAAPESAVHDAPDVSDLALDVTAASLRDTLGTDHLNAGGWHVVKG